MGLPKLPFGIQNFEKLRNLNCLYVDKTKQIYDMITNNSGVVFLARPRRFGKSLICSAIGAVFDNKRELFKGLYIDASDWEWETYPVIRIDLNAGNYYDGQIALYSTIDCALKSCSRQYGIPLEGSSSSEKFSTLIECLYTKFSKPVVVIIDEYDKPLLSTIDKPEICEQLRTALKGFYGVLKTSDQYLKFVFLTGVTKFSQVSVFSDLNQVNDISFDEDYADICGITQEELEQNFEPFFDAAMKENELDREGYLGKLKLFYNGYRFTDKPIKVYNPFGLINHFTKKYKFQSFWYNTGTPAFLMKLLSEQKIDLVNLEKIEVGVNEFVNFSIDKLDALPILYQTGYLTIINFNKDENFYTFDYPNLEVKTAFADSLMKDYFGCRGTEQSSFVAKVPRLLRAGDIDEVMEHIQSFLAGIPYDLAIANERYYQTVIHVLFRMLGFDTDSEIRIAKGRLDTKVETKNNVYCFEFKLNGTAQDAINQINTKDYLTPWLKSGKKLFKIGVKFDCEERNVTDWIIERQ
ncbi:MAG: ATP-binding protein [Planctomycetaceae bacterium]|jgi:hypothetical protein|nr:ATP-binding protein [Planctomycetaceae bacterium]